eukprot:21073-Heterococcus_DN1.PRE.4
MYAYTSHVHSGTVALTTWLHDYVMLPVLRRAYSSRSRRHGQLQRSTTQQEEQHAGSTPSAGCMWPCEYDSYEPTVHLEWCVHSISSLHTIAVAASAWLMLARQLVLLEQRSAVLVAHTTAEGLLAEWCIDTSQHRRTSSTPIQDTCTSVLSLRYFAPMCLLCYACAAVTGMYRNEINYNNPLGAQGKLVEDFAQLLSQLWSADLLCVYPSKFKRSLGKQRSQFAGNDQQDGQEFLTVILDALHEPHSMRPGPLNHMCCIAFGYIHCSTGRSVTVLVKPVVAPPEDDGHLSRTLDEEQISDSRPVPRAAQDGMQVLYM